MHPAEKSRRAPDQRSPDAERYRRLYKTARWLRIRLRQLAEHPLCQWCEAKGRILPATVCHHVDPASKQDAFFDGPFLSLCAPCHDSEAQKIEKIGYSTSIGEDGWPVDERHPANR